MELNGQSVEFIWLPTEDELPEIRSIFESKSQEKEYQTNPVKKLKNFLSKLFDCSVKICNFKPKMTFGSEEKHHSTKSSTPITMFYTEYLFRVDCEIESMINPNCNKMKKIINLFCSKKHGCYIPDLWMKIDSSIFINNYLSTLDYFLDLNRFSLGNLVGLNKFVEHFSSDTSLKSYKYKITQVKAKFLHDSQVLHVNFVVGECKNNIKKRNSNTHKMHRLIIPYSLIHTALINLDKTLIVYFHLYKSPLLFCVKHDDEAENYISYMDLEPTTKWVRTIKLFDSCDSTLSKEFSMNYTLKLDFCKDDYEEVLKIVLYHKNMQLYFTPMSVISYNEKAKGNQPLFQFKTFDCSFGYQCLLTHSYEILDHLICEEEEMNKVKILINESCNPNALSEAFYIIHSAINQCNIIIFSHALKFLYKSLSSRNPVYYSDGIQSMSHHNLLLIKRAVITPTHVRFIPPQPILKSRALRDCNPGYSLRISIRDVNFEPINFSIKSFSEQGKKEFFNTYFKKTILRGIKVADRCYKYVGSSTSQLKGHGFWFYANDDKDSAVTLRRHFGQMEKIKQVPKFMARMGQTFSQAMGYIPVSQEHTNINNPKKDVTGGIKKYLSDENLDSNKKFLKEVPDNKLITEEPYCFSDGIGCISLEIANEVYKILDVEETKPSAMQIRYAGCKGMLVVDPTLKGKKIIFRESMKKFNSESDSLEILKFSEKRAASLNRPLITILEQLGVNKEIFIKLQRQMIQNHIKSMFHEKDACDFLNRNSQLRFDFNGLHKAGIRFTEDPLFRSMIYGLFRKHLDLLKNKANIEIPVNKGRSMFGVLDETFTLEYGQVFIQYSDWITDEPIIHEGLVVVTKNPCMHPGDVRKFEAVNVKTLHHIRDCIVFPAKGPRPHPDEMAGSDLDGDEYHVLWLEDLFFRRENVDAMNFAMHKSHCKELERDITPEDEMDHFCDYIINDNVGLIGSAHLAFADKEKNGIFSENCLRLAKKYAIALDFAKSGIPAVRNRKDKIFNYPDFMMKIDEKITKNTYVSKKALGLLYRNCKCLEMGLETANSEIEYKVDMDLICENWEKYKKSAEQTYKKYCQKIEYLINIYSFENEGELLVGAVINPPKYYEQRHDLENLKVLLEYEIQWIFRDLQKEFFKEFSGKPVDMHYTEEMFQKASAWYAVTYLSSNDGRKNQYFGFPWSVADLLKKLKENRYIHKGYKAYNKRTLLAEAIDKNLSSHMPEISEDSNASEILKNIPKILDVAYRVLIKWLNTQRDIFMIPNLTAYKAIIEKEFQSVSIKFIACDIKYIENLKAKNAIHQVISPFHYILTTMLAIASMKHNFTVLDFQQELGLLSWVTLIKLACTYNPLYLGIASENGNYVNPVIYVPQDNIVSTVKVQLYDQTPSNEAFSNELINNPKKVTNYLKKQTKLKDVDFRYGIEGNKEYIAIFTVMGSRYAIEKLKDLIILNEFFNWVVNDKQLM